MHTFQLTPFPMHSATAYCIYMIAVSACALLRCRMSANEAGETKAECVHHSWSADDNCRWTDVLCWYTRGTV